MPEPILVIPALFVFVLLGQYMISRGFDYKCGKCGNEFSPSILTTALAPHNFGRKLLRCPECGKIGWAKPIHKNP